MKTGEIFELKSSVYQRFRKDNTANHYGFSGEKVTLLADNGEMVVVRGRRCKFSCKKDNLIALKHLVK